MSSLLYLITAHYPTLISPPRTSEKAIALDSPMVPGGCAISLEPPRLIILEPPPPHFDKQSSLLASYLITAHYNCMASYYFFFLQFGNRILVMLIVSSLLIVVVCLPVEVCTLGMFRDISRSLMNLEDLAVSFILSIVMYLFRFALLKRDLVLTVSANKLLSLAICIAAIVTVATIASMHGCSL